MVYPAGGAEAFQEAFAEKAAWFIADGRLTPENARNKALAMYKEGDLEIDYRDTGILFYYHFMTLSRCGNITLENTGLTPLVIIKQLMAVFTSADNRAG